MDRKVLESAAIRATNLRGLRDVPAGLVFASVGLGNLAWGPYKHDWFFIAVIVLLVMTFPLIDRYYNRIYGTATLSAERQLKNTAVSLVFFGVGLIGGMLLDWAFDVPVSLFVITFAIAMLGWYAIALGLRPHHVIIWGSLLVVGLIPMWGDLEDSVSVGWIPIGIATIVCGLLDHRALVRSFGIDDDNA